MGNQYGGESISVLAGIIGWFISYGLLYGILTLHDFIFCPFQPRKKCSLRTCLNHYYNWLQVEKNIWYRECYVCHQEYVLFCFKYETTVNADGTLNPYLKRTKWGWQKDDKIDSEILDLVTPEVVHQMQEKWKKQVGKSKAPTDSK
jgi:hypothetical protein